jgi:hypothetical protein
MKHKDSTDRVVGRHVQPELQDQLRQRLGGHIADLRVLAQDNGLVQVAQETLQELTPLPLLANEIEVG